MKKQNYFKRAIVFSLVIFAMVLSTKVNAQVEKEVDDSESGTICRCHTSSAECHEGHLISFRKKCDCTQPVEFCGE